MRKQRPSVSVVVSVYNAEKTIDKSVESIINQTYSDIEILITDDGSTDNSYEILRNLSIKYENLKIFKNTQNIGLTKSLNNLIRESSGDFIARHDIDDFSHSKRLETQMKIINSNNLDFCLTRAYEKNSERIIPNKSYFLPDRFVLKFKNPFIHGTLVIRKKVIHEIGLYNEKFYYAQDYRLFKDLLINNFKYKVIKTPLYDLNMKNNISTNKLKEQNYYAKCVKNNEIPEKII